MRRFLVVLFVLLLACPSMIGFAEGNLIQNGSFEETADGWPVSWVRDMWQYEQGITYLYLSMEGLSGGQCAVIENVSPNDARFVQTVSVEPRTKYRLSGSIKAEGCDTQKGGAGFSILGVYEIFPSLFDTQGEWVEMTCYIETDKDQTSIQVAARLGGYAAETKGKAWFDDISLEKIEKLPSGEKCIFLIGQKEQSVQSQSTEIKDAAVMPSLIWVGLFLFVIVGLLVLRTKGLSLPKYSILILLAGAAALRVFLMLTQAGHMNDMNAFCEWALRMVRYGPGEFYNSRVFCDYPPGYMYLLWVTGVLLRLFDISSLYAPETQLLACCLVKLIPVLCDMGIIVCIWRASKKRIGDMPALLLAALYAFSPAILMDGAIWGQADAVVTLGLILTVLFALKRNWLVALPIFTATVLMKPQALIAGPIGVAALALDIWQSGRVGLPGYTDGTSKGKSGGTEGKAALAARKGLLLNAAKGLMLSVCVGVLMLLPFLWGKEQPIAWVVDLYTSSMSGYPMATLNTANFYYLIGANWIPLTNMLGPFTYGTWGTLFMVTIMLSLIAIYLRKGDRENLPLYCALAYILLYLFGVMMHERYLFPALALLLLAYTRKRDWRLLFLFCGFSITFYINCMIVLRDMHLPLEVSFTTGALSVVNLLLGAFSVWVLIDHRVRPFPINLGALIKDNAPDTPTQSTRERRLSAIRGDRTPGFFAQMRRVDYLVMTTLTIIYAVIGYTGLGVNVAPQTNWMSTGVLEEVIFDLGETHTIETLFYPGINAHNQTFTLEFSEDGDIWYGLAHAQAEIGSCFSWKYVTVARYDSDGAPIDYTDTKMTGVGRYVRMLTYAPSVNIMEIVFRDPQGNTLPVKSVISEGYREESRVDPALLTDEGDTAPVNPTYENSTYFDEIYHARTAYEHANQLSTYEYTHPPLGKVMIMFAIKLFGMTPFGWRFMGTLMGVLMVPAMYLLGKQLFKRTRFAALAAFLMAFDMMHLTQTRIATIDSYAVLYIILMYLCMFRYLQMNVFRDGWRTLLPLFLSGLFFGLGCASKWICLYAGVGLAVLFFWSMVQRFLEWKAAMDSGDTALQVKVAVYFKYMLGTLTFCVLCFIMIPFAIYYYSYIPHFAYEGGLTWRRFWDTQSAIYRYHSTLVDNHDFKSPWYQWPLMLRPMYYYNGFKYAGEGNVSTIMCMGNPAIWWVGFCAFFYVAWQWLKPHLLGKKPKDHHAAMILLAFAAQFVPWMLVPRSMFIYHYFGSLPFVMLCIVYAFERIDAKNPLLARRLQIGYMVVVLLLFIAFYPFATGVPFPKAWAEAMNWLGFLRLQGSRFKGWLFF